MPNSSFIAFSTGTMALVVQDAAAIIESLGSMALELIPETMFLMEPFPGAVSRTPWMMFMDYMVKNQPRNRFQWLNSNKSCSIVRNSLIEAYDVSKSIVKAVPVSNFKTQCERIRIRTYGSKFEKRTASFSDDKTLAHVIFQYETSCIRLSFGFTSPHSKMNLTTNLFSL